MIQNFDRTLYRVQTFLGLSYLSEKLMTDHKFA